MFGAATPAKILDLQKDESVGKTLENLSALISAMVHSQTHEPDNI